MSTTLLQALNAVHDELRDFPDPANPALKLMRDVKIWYKDVVNRTKDIYPFVSVGEMSSSTVPLTCGPGAADKREVSMTITIGCKNMAEDILRTQIYGLAEKAYSILWPNRFDIFWMPAIISQPVIAPVNTDQAGHIWEAKFELTGTILATRATLK